MNKVFISYRREDSQDAAGRISDRLSKEFGPNAIFMDVDNIPLGADFREHLRTSVMQCDIFLAVIGKHWLDSKNSDGNRRVDDKNDFVRFEIELALKQKRTLVIPLLLHGTAVPSPEELPASLKELAYRTAVDIRHTHFQRDLDKLVEHLRNMPPATNSSHQSSDDSSISSASSETARGARPPALGHRIPIRPSPLVPTPPKRMPQRNSKHWKLVIANSPRLTIVVAIVVAIGLVGWIVFKVLQSDSGGIPMIP